MLQERKQEKHVNSKMSVKVTVVMKANVLIFLHFQLQIHSLILMIKVKTVMLKLNSQLEKVLFYHNVLKKVQVIMLVVDSKTTFVKVEDVESKSNIGVIQETKICNV